MNVHTYSEAADKLIRNPLITEPVKQILDSDVYVFQCILNLKRAFTGDVWQWHQDYGTWARDDEMPQALAMNIALFLDEVTEFNGPLYIIPRSPWDRVIVYLSLCRVDNHIRQFKRPEWIAHRDFAAIEPLADDCLLH